MKEKIIAAEELAPGSNWYVLDGKVPLASKEFDPHNPETYKRVLQLNVTPDEPPRKMFLTENEIAILRRDFNERA